jgi:hypothetical protein
VSHSRPIALVGQNSQKLAQKCISLLGFCTENFCKLIASTEVNASNDLFAVTINFLHGKNALTRENFKSCDLLGFYKLSRTGIVREKSQLWFCQ